MSETPDDSSQGCCALRDFRDTTQMYILCERCSLQGWNMQPCYQPPLVRTCHMANAQLLTRYTGDFPDWSVWKYSNPQTLESLCLFFFPSHSTDFSLITFIRHKVHYLSPALLAMEVWTYFPYLSYSKKRIETAGCLPIFSRSFFLNNKLGLHLSNNKMLIF